MAAVAVGSEKENAGRPVSRVLYPLAGGGRRADGGHLSSPTPGWWARRARSVPRATPFRGASQGRVRAALPPGSSGQPGDGPDTHCPPIWPCSRRGLTAGMSPYAAGRSYRPISPLPPVAGGGMFLCHFPSPPRRRRAIGATAQGDAATPGSYPAPCPVEPGLSSPQRRPAARKGRGVAARRPPGRSGVLRGEANIRGFKGQGGRAMAMGRALRCGALPTCGFRWPTL